MRRILARSIKFFWTGADAQGRAADGFARGAIVKGGLFFRGNDGRQEGLFEDVVSLDEAFFRALSDHPVPLLEGAIRQLKDRSMSLDIYVWLAYRLHALERPTAIGWAGLHAQFGNGFRHARQFRPYFLDALAAAAAAYPDAGVEVGEGGVTLRPSRPPVPRLA